MTPAIPFVVGFGWLGFAPLSGWASSDGLTAPMVLTAIGG